jgi:hypothetical protein
MNQLQWLHITAPMSWLLERRLLICLSQRMCHNLLAKRKTPNVWPLWYQPGALTYSW